MTRFLRLSTKNGEEGLERRETTAEVLRVAPALRSQMKECPKCVPAAIKVLPGRYDVT